MPTMMGIRKMRMGVHELLVLVSMGVPNAQVAWEQMRVPVVFVVVMLMHVFQSLMPVFVSVMFRQV